MNVSARVSKAGVTTVSYAAWRRIDDVPEGEAALRWLYGVSKRVLLNHRRSRRRLHRLTARLVGTATAPIDGPESVVLRRAEHAELLAALESLPERDQEVLRLATWEELPRAEIAELLGCSRHAVDQRIYRATRRLAREVGRTGHKSDEGTIPVTQPRTEAK